MVNRISEQRQKHNTTLEQLSEKSGIPVKELAKYERQDYDINKMSAVKAANIAEALGCYIKDLIYED